MCDYEQLQVVGWETFADLVMLFRSNFIDKDNAFDNATHIFFNNFGPWFDSQNPGKTPGLNNEFADKVSASF
jgi:hypothetical protein